MGIVIKLWKSAEKATLGAEKDAKNKGEREKTKLWKWFEMILNFIMIHLTNFS